MRRIAETGRAPVAFTLNGVPATALAGDTVLTAVLTRQGHLRHDESGGQPRAGFCLMGACQDCWVRVAGGPAVRACSTFVTEGLAVLTGPAGGSAP